MRNMHQIKFALKSFNTQGWACPSQQLPEAMSIRTHKMSFHASIHQDMCLFILNLDTHSLHHKSKCNIGIALIDENKSSFEQKLESQLLGPQGTARLSTGSVQRDSAQASISPEYPSPPAEYLQHRTTPVGWTPLPAPHRH